MSTIASIDARQRLTEAKRIVVKIGSALIFDGEAIRQAWLNALAEDIAGLSKTGPEIVLVSSGAVALGRAGLGGKRPKRLEEKQAAAALGQPLLMSALAEAFQPHGKPVAQALLTLDDTERRRRWLNARATLQTLLSVGALPVINENDSVATDEIRYGDNDRLAARVAQMIGADILILLSDIDGLYTADPKSDPAATHIPVIETLSEDVLSMASGANTVSDVGSGGMVTKLAAAGIACQAGCTTVITLGKTLRPLTALSDGGRATWVLPDTTPDKARETWLRGHLTPEGSLTLDAGAVTALRGGSSLLAVGVTGVEGHFLRGAAVALKGPDGDLIAKGVTAYSAEDIARVRGLRTEEVEAVLGYRGRPAIVHRDDLVLDA